jgi:hypothetical protein
VTCSSSRAGGERLSYLACELLALFVQAYLREALVIETGVDFEYILQAPDEIGLLLWAGWTTSPLARALWHFFESTPDQLSGDGLLYPLGALQLYGPIRQKPHAPALFVRRRFGAGQSD